MRDLKFGHALGIASVLFKAAPVRTDKLEPVLKLLALSERRIFASLNVLPLLIGTSLSQQYAGAGAEFRITGSLSTYDTDVPLGPAMLARIEAEKIAFLGELEKKVAASRVVQRRVLADSIKNIALLCKHDEVAEGSFYMKGGIDMIKE